MANLQGTTVTGDLAITGTTSGQGAVPVGAVLPIISALSGSHTIPNTGTVDADGWQYCDGANIPSSQTLSGATPNLTDGRFLRGFTSSSGCGGAATFTLGLGNLAAHDHGGATTSASTTPGATGSCGQTSASTTPGATGACGQTSASTTPGAGGSTTPGAGSGCGQTSASTTPGAGSACSATTGGCGQTTATFSANHTHGFTTGAQNCQHCHCICDSGVHSHMIYVEGGTNRYCSGGGGVAANQNGVWKHHSDGRHHCAQHTCCTLSSVTHLHSGTTGTVSSNHTHTTPSHTHTTPSHTHTGGAHTHTTPSHTHTGAAHTHTSTAHTHTTPDHTHTSAAHTHTTPAHTHTSAAHTHATTVASAGSGTAVSHVPIYFNVKYLIRVI